MHNSAVALEQERRNRQRLEIAKQNPARRNAIDPLDHRLECPLGRLRISGKISEAEYQAGISWRNTYLAYLASIGAPFPFVQAIDSAESLVVGTPSIEMSDADCELAKVRFMRGARILQACGKRVFHALNAIAVFEEPDELGDLEFTVRAARIGLSRLAKTF